MLSLFYEKDGAICYVDTAHFIREDVGHDLNSPQRFRISQGERWWKLIERIKRLGRRRHSLHERPSPRIMERRESAYEPTWGL